MILREDVDVIAAMDPGFTGAVAIMDRHGTMEVFDMPIIGTGSRRMINAKYLADRLSESRVQHAVIERVGAMPKQGVSSSFRFGVGYGQLIGVVGALAIPYDLVSPRKWKGQLGLSSDKELSRQRAIELFPQESDRFSRKKDEGRAEAVLLGLWWLEQ